MIKRNPYGDTLKQQLTAALKDKLYNFFLDDGRIRGSILLGTRMINEMRANHEIGILETLILGHAYMGVALMSSSLKGNERIRMDIECSGPVKGLVTEASSFGDIRGYLKHIPIPVEKPLDSFDLSPFFGAGFLSVTRFFENEKHPYTGNIMLQYGNIAQDLAHYYLHSEQIPTSFNLSIQFDPEGNVTGAGGLLLQAMPDARIETVTELETVVRGLPSLGALLAKGTDPVQFVTDVFHRYSPQFLGNRRIEFMCHCGHDYLLAILAQMPPDEIADMLSRETFPLELRCQYCNSVYYFEKSELEHIIGSNGHKPSS